MAKHIIKGIFDVKELKAEKKKVLDLFRELRKELKKYKG